MTNIVRAIWGQIEHMLIKQLLQRRKFIRVTTWRWNVKHWSFVNVDFRKITSDQETANLLIISKIGGHLSLVTFCKLWKYGRMSDLCRGSYNRWSLAIFVVTFIQKGKQTLFLHHFAVPLISLRYSAGVRCTIFWNCSKKSVGVLSPELKATSLMVSSEFANIW